MTDNWKGPKIVFEDGSTMHDPRNVELAKKGSNKRFVPGMSIATELPVRRSRKEKPPRSATATMKIGGGGNPLLAVAGIALMLITLAICIWQATK